MLIEISSLCNLSCKTCSRKQRTTEVGDMTLDTFKMSIDKLVDSEFSNFVFLAGFGESMINPHFFDMIRYAKRKGCRIMLPTNGTLINEDNVGWLRLIDTLQISFNTFKNIKQRGLSYKKLLDLIPLLRKYHINFMLNVALGEDNWNEVYDFILFHRQTGIPLNFIAMRPIFETDDFLYKEMQFLSSKLNELKSLIEPFPNIYIDESCRSFENSRMRYTDFAIAWNGDVFPCSFAFFTVYKFGNIKDFRNLNAIKEIQERNDYSYEICEFCKKNDAIIKKEQSKIKRKTDFIKSVHNIYEGKKCFVLGTGRSITKEVLDVLKNEITIGVNGIAYAKEKWAFEPKYFCLSDFDAFQSEMFGVIEQLNCPIITTDYIKYQGIADYQMVPSDLMKERWKKAVFVKWKDAKTFRYSTFPRTTLCDSNDISLNLLEGTAMTGTVVQDVAIPFASWLGCNEIYLLGCECDEKGHFYDPSNTKSGLTPLLKHQYKYFQEKLLGEGKKLINLTPSQLPSIPNMHLNEVIKTH